ncbi:MarR family winged helix-turn-helix transcriptional regulator [Paraburkholderia sp. GAS334]|uniref:MarR family winged helix-turn-helix transcriptional regulator n=1 Tax=Paraburkholderia sp. GAS334 TaxID=3035131 RepID=UPI003D201244
MDSKITYDFASTRRLILALNRARKILTAEINDALRQFGVDAKQMRILLELAHERANSPGALAKLLDIDTGQMTRALDGLEKKELLRRYRRLDDRRALRLALTGPGREMAVHGAPILMMVENRRLALLSDTESNALSRLLKKLLDQ